MATSYKGFGSIELVRGIVIALKEDFNDVYTSMVEEWQAADEAYAVAMEIPYVELVVELVEPENIHAGSLPSFIQSDDRVQNFPLIAVVPERTVPDSADAESDQVSVYQNGISIHSFGRGNPNEVGVDMAYAAWLRAERMADAIDLVVARNPLLRKATSGNSKPSLVERSEPWLFPEHDGHGKDWCWVAVRHLYNVRNRTINR